MGRLVHTGLGSSSLVAHVLHYPPPPHANSFVLGPAVIKHTQRRRRKRRREGTTSRRRESVVYWYSIPVTSTPQWIRSRRRRRRLCRCSVEVTELSTKNNTLSLMRNLCLPWVRLGSPEDFEGVDEVRSQGNSESPLVI